MASPELEDELLAKLKAQQEEFDARFTRIGIHGVRLPDGPAEDAESALSSYLCAIAQERDVSLTELKQKVQAAESFNPEDIKEKLHEDAVRTRQKEGSPGGRETVAGKKMAAYIRQEQVLRRLESGPGSMEEDRYDIKPMAMRG